MKASNSLAMTKDYMVQIRKIWEHSLYMHLHEFKQK